MKINIKYSIVILVLATLFTACKDDFLERYPQSEISPQQFFNTEKDLELLTNGFYSALPEDDIYMSDFFSDNVDISGMSEVLNGTRIVPTAASTAGWTWQPLYNINYFLDNYNKPTISSEARNHYSGIARFFRAYFYFEKLKRFGDVPFYNKPLNEQSPELYKARDPRTLVTDSIIADLDYAIANLRSAKTPGRVNKWAALAFKSRVCLFEGTFRKYHNEFNLPGAQALLQEAAEAADLFMRTSPYKLATGAPSTVYLNLFSSQTPHADEYILASLYGLEVNRSHVANAVFTSPTRNNPGITKSLVDSYLMKDGRPFSALPNYDKLSFFDEVQNRDPRLSQTIRTPGYRRIGASPVSAPLLPDYANTFTGYQNIKFVSTPDQDAAAYTPLPLIRYAEVLLNYAEAKAELQQLTQAEADRSINLIRARTGIPKLLVNAIPNDPIIRAQYIHTSDPVILEVRRERRIELVMEGFRYYDLMRWKEGHLLAEKFKGVYFPSKGLHDLDGDGKNDLAVVDVRPAPPASGIQYLVLGNDKALSNGTSGNVIVHDNVVKKFDESKDYLYPLPLNELTLNKNLKQNPEWK